jgi:hypothetical protein
MGADAFVAFYGLHYTLSDDEADAVEQQTDARVTAAKRAKLQTYFGRLTDGEPYFLLLGTRLGVFGVENECGRSFDAAALDRIMRETATKLRKAGLPDTPQLHLQLVAKY